MRCTLMASDRVTVGSNPSGTLATMMPIAKIRLSWLPMPTSQWLSRKITAPSPRAMAVIVRTIWATCSSRVLGLRGVWADSRATWANSVSAPVANTIPVPRPEATVVPASARLPRSPAGSSGCLRAPAWRASGSDSPLSSDRSR